MNKIGFVRLLVLLSFLLLQNSLESLASNRIISLIPSSTELLFAIGFGKEIIAVSNYCNYPKDEITKLPRIGDQVLNIEKIISLKPSILVDTNGIHKKYESLFKKLKLNYINIDIKSQSDIPWAASYLAELLGDKERANDFIDNWNKEINNLKLLPNSKIVKIYAEISNNPIQAVGSNNNIDSIIQVAGGKNILSSIIDYPLVNSEKVLLSNPEIIILIYPDANVESIKSRPGWKNIKAVKNNHIFIVDQDLIVRPGPRNLQAIMIINKIINKVITNGNNE